MPLAGQFPTLNAQNVFRTRRGPASAPTELVDYLVRDEPGAYQENDAGKNGQESQALCLVAWQDRQKFREAVLADVRLPVPVFGHGLQTKTLNRYLPEKHPHRPHLPAVEAQLVRGVGVADVDPDNKWLAFTQFGKAAGSGFAEIRVTFRASAYGPKWDVEDAAVEASSVGELARWVSKTMHPNAEATQIGGTSFFVVPEQGDPAGPPQVVGNESPAKVLPFALLKYTHHMVPGLPLALVTQNAPLIDLGKVNSLAFDPASYFRQALPPGSVLYLGTEISEVYYTVSGTPVVDLTHDLGFRPQTWNKVFRRSVAGFRELVRRVNPGDPITSVGYPAAAGRHPYDDYDMANLFKFEAALP